MSVPPRQPRPNQPSIASNASISAGGSRNAAVTDATATSGSDTNPRRVLVFQQDQDLGTGTGTGSRAVIGALDTTSNSRSRSNNHPFTARRRESRPDQQHRRHGATTATTTTTNNNNNNNNNTTSGQMRTPVISRLSGGPPPAPRPSHITSRIPGPIQPPSAARPAHTVARLADNVFELPVDDPFTSRRPIATPRHLRRGGVGRTQANVGFDSPELNASPITPWDMMFTPNTQAIETTAVVGTPVTSRLADSFSSIVVTPELEDSQEERSSSTTGVSTALFIKRPSRIAFEEAEEEDEEEGDASDNGGIHPGDKVLDDDDVESFLSKRESLIRGRRAIEKQPRRLSSHAGPHDMYYSTSSVGMATPEGFTTPQSRILPPLSTQLPTRTPGVVLNRFNTSLMSRDDPDTPVSRNNRDQANDEPPSLWTNAARRAMLDLKKHVYQGESDEAQVQGARGEMFRSSNVIVADLRAEEETPLGTSRILPSSLIRRSEPERDPFLQTPRPDRDPYNQESGQGHAEELSDEHDFGGDLVFDKADLDQDFRSVAADTAFISEGHDSIAELIYEAEDLEEERRRRSEIREVIRANRSFELGLKAAREEAEAEATVRAAAAEATEAAAVQELLDARAKSAEAIEVEVEEAEDKIFKRQLDAEVERAMSIFDEDVFDEPSDMARHLPPTSVLLNELVQERNGRQLTTSEELECRTWMYEGGRVGKPQRVGVWARA